MESADFFASIGFSLTFCRFGYFSHYQHKLAKALNHGHGLDDILRQDWTFPTKLIKDFFQGYKSSGAFSIP